MAITILGICNNLKISGNHIKIGEILVQTRLIFCREWKNAEISIFRLFWPVCASSSGTFPGPCGWKTLSFLDPDTVISKPTHTGDALGLLQQPATIVSLEKKCLANGVAPIRQHWVTEPKLSPFKSWASIFTHNGISFALGAYAKKSPPPTLTDFHRRWPFLDPQKLFSTFGPFSNWILAASHFIAQVHPLKVLCSILQLHPVMWPSQLSTTKANRSVDNVKECIELLLLYCDTALSLPWLIILDKRSLRFTLCQ